MVRCGKIARYDARKVRELAGECGDRSQPLENFRYDQQREGFSCRSRGIREF